MQFDLVQKLNKWWQNYIQQNMFVQGRRQQWQDAFLQSVHMIHRAGKGQLFSFYHIGFYHTSLLTTHFTIPAWSWISIWWSYIWIVVELKWYHWLGQSECRNKEETTCMIQSSDGQIFGDVSCTKYALERLSDSIKKPILAYLKEQENDRLRQLDSEVRLFWPRDKAINTVHIQ